MSLHAHDLNFGHKSGPQYRNLSLCAKCGELICLLGPNGSGKSSLLRALVGIMPLHSGSLLFDGRNLRAMSRRNLAKVLAYVPQNTPLASISVQETLLLGRTPYLRFASSKNDMAAVDAALDRLGITAWKERSLLELSGGERQKVLLARALAQDTPIILLDEPTSNLDVRYQFEVYELFSQLCRTENKIVIMAEHDLNLAARFASQVQILHNNTIVVSGPPENILNPDLLRKVYAVESQIIMFEGKTNIMTLGLAEGM